MNSLLRASMSQFQMGVFARQSRHFRVTLQCLSKCVHSTNSITQFLSPLHSHHCRTPFYYSSIHLRILNCLSTKASTSASQETSESSSSQPTATTTSQKQLWKSSAAASLFEEEAARAKSFREQLYRRLDNDIGSVIKEDMIVYELVDTSRYRWVLVFAVMQFFFWTVCANLLYMFYMGVDSEGNKLRSLRHKQKQEVGNENASFLRTWFQNLTGGGLSQTSVQILCVSIGTLCGVAILFFLTRVVSFIRLTPGAKKVHVGHLTVLGGKSPRKYQELSLSDLSTTSHRLEPVNMITMQVRGRYFGFLIDRDGRFPREEIYDQTIGVQRNVIKPVKSNK